MEHEVRRMEGMGQLGLGFDFGRGRQEQLEVVVGEEDLFLDAEPRELFVGSQRLEVFLEANGLSWVVGIAGLLKELDYSALVRSYKRTGRRALHPRVMLGLIVYGIFNRQWSLRELEGLARRDVGAWWVCGGHQPDHSTIGKFIQLHAEVLTEEFFVGLVRRLVNKLRLAPGVVAADGTVIESAASHFRTLRAEAAAEAAAQAERSQVNAEQVEQARTVAALAQARSVDRRARGGDAEAPVVAPSDPDALIQPRKDGVVRPTYKPSIMVHESRLIVGQRLEPGSETAALAPMLNQHAAAFASEPARLLLDAGFSSIGLFSMLVARDIDVLCPAGRTNGDGEWHKQSRTGRFTKHHFRYDPHADRYHCPAGRELAFSASGVDRKRRKFRVYRSPACKDCVLRERCTTSAVGRSIKRFEGEELKEAMVEVLAQPRARRQFRRRGAIAEPPFAHLRERQGLRRFRRRGLPGVRAEFALHCIAYDLRMAIGQLDNRALILCLLLYTRVASGRWQLFAVLIITQHNRTV